MSKKQTALFIIAVVLVAAIGMLTIIVLDSNKRIKGNLEANFAKKNKTYKFLMNNFMTRNSLSSIVTQISNLAIYNYMEIRILAVNFYISTLLISLAVFVAGAVLTKDFMATVFIALYAMVMRNVLINNRIEDASYKLLTQYSSTLSSLYETYTRTHDIVDSIATCRKGPSLVKPFEQIYDVLTAVNAMDKLNEFYSASPFKQLRTLATISLLLGEEGDTKNEKDQYAYQQALMLIKNEVDSEIEGRLTQKTLFNMLEYLPLAPIFVIGPLQSFFMSNIPGTSIVYQGMLGYIARILIVVVSFASYYIITTINRKGVVRDDDRLGFIMELMRIKPFMHIVHNIMPKTLKDIKAGNKRLKGALSSQNLEYVYASKLVFSCIGVIFTTVAILVTVQSAKEFTYSNVKSLSFTGGTDMTEEEEKQLYLFDSQCLDAEMLLDDTSLYNGLKVILPKKSEMDILEQVERVKKKYNTYHNIGYKWWFILIIYAVGVGFWFIPEGLLKLRKYLVKVEADEDVMQMQTLIAILMYTPLDTLDIIYWLEKNSTVHKDALLFAYHEYPSNAEMALDRLKSKSAVPEFISMCDKLMSTITEVTLREAFPDLISQREHTMRMAETVRNNTIEKKRRLASPIAMAPLAILVVGLVLLPIGLLGFQEFSNTLGNLGF